ncbi:MAG: radical SAM protein [Candidatus Entotheonellia bacterium]
MTAARSDQPLGDLLAQVTKPGELYRALPGKWLQCYACGHRCKIPPGRPGICKVRFNEAGILKVPAGYVGALQCDPVEKKPFFHALPGALALSFGMLGCDFHCGYCFAPETTVVTNKGAVPMVDLFSQGQEVMRIDNAEIAFPRDLRAVTASGKLRPVRKVFKHRYSGELMVVRPYCLPELRCTPDHKIYATEDPLKPPEPIEAGKLTGKHYLVVPRYHHFSSPQVLDVCQVLSAFEARFKTPHKLSILEVDHIMTASAAGASSRKLGLEFGKHPSYIRHVRSKMRRGMWTDGKKARLIIEGETVRFAKERRPGIPLKVLWDENFARLLGYYCAEGSVKKAIGRPNSYSLVFTFGLHEIELAKETQWLMELIFGVKVHVLPRRTTLAVTTNKSSVALIFKAMCGNGSIAKHVPQAIFEAPRVVIEAFLDAYMLGDGHRYANGKSSVTTKSRQLAFDIAWLALKTGRLPSLYENQVAVERSIEGRRVKQWPHQYTVVWYDGETVKRRGVSTDDFYFVPIRSVDRVEFDGDVYNLEVDEEHNYLANFALVSNCQNWMTSQALRDPLSDAQARPTMVAAERLAQEALRLGAPIVASTYNEPLITSEWAVEVFKHAKTQGLTCAYISNGNGTLEVLDYLRPWVDLYKVDLKGFDDKHYRELGGVLENVLNTIGLLHQKGFWLEVVTLVIPGFNDSNDELRRIAEFLVSVSPDIPWHVTAFHQDYKMRDRGDTGVRTLLRAAEIGVNAGLHFVYAGNLPGRVGPYENTYCPACHTLLIERYGYTIRQNVMSAGACPKCRLTIPGVWR